MYPCIFRFIYHKGITLLITKCIRQVVRAYALYLYVISYCLKRLPLNQFVSWHLVAYADGEALLKLVN